MSLIVTVDHARGAGLCVAGMRAWFDRHGLDFRDFLDRGIEADRLLATGDAMALRAVDAARQAAGRV